MKFATVFNSNDLIDEIKQKIDELINHPIMYAFLALDIAIISLSLTLNSIPLVNIVMIAIDLIITILMVILMATGGMDAVAEIIEGILIDAVKGNSDPPSEGSKSTYEKIWNHSPWVDALILVISAGVTYALFKFSKASIPSWIFIGLCAAILAWLAFGQPDIFKPNSPKANYQLAMGAYILAGFFWLGGVLTTLFGVKCVKQKVIMLIVSGIQLLTLAAELFLLQQSPAEDNEVVYYDIPGTIPIDHEKQITLYFLEYEQKSDFTVNIDADPEYTLINGILTRDITQIKERLPDIKIGFVNINGEEEEGPTISYDTIKYKGDKHTKDEIDYKPYNTFEGQYVSFSFSVVDDDILEDGNNDFIDINPESTDRIVSFIYDSVNGKLYRDIGLQKGEYDDGDVLLEKEQGKTYYEIGGDSVDSLCGIIRFNINIQSTE